MNLGLMLVKGDGVNRDAARAKALLGQACELGLGIACHRLVDLSAQPRGPITPEGYALLEQACKADDFGACLRLSRLSKSIGPRQEQK